MRKYPGLCAFLLAVVLSGVMLNYILADKEQDFAEFGLGEATAAYFAYDQNYPIHIDSLKPEVVDSVVRGWELRGKKEVVFLFGNSQMHGINQFSAGEKSYNHILFDSLHTHVDVLAQSVPNANLQEFLYMFQFWKSRVDLSKVVAPVFFDDLREDEIRFAYSPENNASVKLSLASPSPTEWNAAIKEYEVSANANPDNAALANTVQERVELYLDARLSKLSETWRNRPAMRGQLFTSLYLLRNRIFGINPQSVRRILPMQYQRNMHALELFLASAHQENVEVLLYIPPIRSDVAIPYDPDEYAKFKEDIAMVVSRYPRVEVHNLEKIVAGEYWGMKESTTLGASKLEYDFMHFSFNGHKALASSLYQITRRSQQ